MYLQINVGDKKPTYYKFHKSEVLIGSLLACDITISESSISKRHLKLFIEKPHWQILDNGSTNGTFVFEDRMIPGKRIDFTEGMEIRLGVKVFLKIVKNIGNNSFVDVKEKPIPEVKTVIAEKTTIISMDDFKAAETLARKKKEQALIEKRRLARIKKIKDRIFMYKVTAGVLAFLAVAFYFNQTFKFNPGKNNIPVNQKLKEMSKGSPSLDKIE